MTYFVDFWLSANYDITIMWLIFLIADLSINEEVHSLKGL